MLVGGEGERGGEGREREREREREVVTSTYKMFSNRRRVGAASPVTTEEGHCVGKLVATASK